MPDLSMLPTPCLVLDRARLVANTARMAARARALDVALRPHLKTAKCVEVATMAAGAGGPLTVSTVREAAFFGAHGFHDRCLAVCVTADKVDEVARGAGSGCTLITDDLEVARAIATHPLDLRAHIEIDSGEHRTGLLPDDPLVVRLAEVLGDRLAGVLTHGGHSYDCTGIDEVRRVAAEERDAVLHAASVLRARGHRVPVVSLGSTPTCTVVDHLHGVDEMRPGVYVFGDLFQAGLGSCAIDDIAVSVLATVISARPDRMVLDAGGLALSKDRSTAGQAFDAGYGRVADLATARPLGELKVDRVHQEHGEVLGGSLPVGTRVRVLPNHVCMTAAMYDRYAVVDGDTEVVASWARTNGWR